MPLINCPDCGHEVSDAAVSCPGCARPIAEVKQEATVPETVLNRNRGCGDLLLLMILLAAVAVFAMVYCR